MLLEGVLVHLRHLHQIRKLSEDPGLLDLHQLLRAVQFFFDDNHLLQVSLTIF